MYSTEIIQNRFTNAIKLKMEKYKRPGPVESSQPTPLSLFQQLKIEKLSTMALIRLVLAMLAILATACADVLDDCDDCRSPVTALNYGPIPFGGVSFGAFAVSAAIVAKLQYKNI